jgi:hypothetical protein
VEELRAKGEANAAALADTQGFAEAAAPDYNLTVGFFAPASTKEIPLTDSTGAKVGKVTNVELRVYNVAPPAEAPPPKKEATEEEEAEESGGEEAPPPPAPIAAPAPRRAEGVSVTVMFPADVGVTTVAATGANVKKFPRPTGTLVTLDWGAGRPLHPDTYFSFRARVKPVKKGDYEMTVVADANNAFAAQPSFIGKLRLTAD